MKSTCRLCKHVFVEDNPEIMKIRKERHEIGRHAQHNVIGERPYQQNKISKSGMGGLIIGKVEWEDEE